MKLQGAEYFIVTGAACKRKAIDHIGLTSYRSQVVLLPRPSGPGGTVWLKTAPSDQIVPA